MHQIGISVNLVRFLRFQVDRSKFEKLQIELFASINDDKYLWQRTFMRFTRECVRCSISASLWREHSM